MHHFAHTARRRLALAVLVQTISLLLCWPVSGQESDVSVRCFRLGSVPGAQRRAVRQAALAEALDMGYIQSHDEVPDYAAHLQEPVVLQRTPGNGPRRELVIGLQAPGTEPGEQAWALGVCGAVLREGGARPNPEVLDVLGAAGAALTVPVRELEHQVYLLSAIDAESATAILGQLGYNTTPPTGDVPLADLPAVFPMAGKINKSVVGGGQPVAEKTLEEQTLSAPDHRLMIVYHQSQRPDTVGLTEVIDQTVDVPARQVLIEGMLIELNEEDAREIGTQWTAYPDESQRISFTQDGEQVPFILKFDPSMSTPDELVDSIKATLRIAVEEGKAEVLSSPSVLVLNDRNAKIQVVQDVPIVTTIIRENTTDLSVDYRTVGIILNIKPRISGDTDTVAMQILVEVSEAPEEDFVVVNDQNVAPLINRRVVETVARVQDNTPFIIGGLIRNEKATTVDRVPLLSHIPIVGWLFKTQTDRRAKREVIIVLTPRIIERGGTQRPVLPKDSERFDFLDNRLFRNSYRLKAEDVFDLRFLERNRLLVRAFRHAREYVRDNPRAARRWPVGQFARGVIPGEEAVVVRMLYEIVGKLELPAEVMTGNLLFFEEDATKPSGFGVRFLEPTLMAKAPGEMLESYFQREYPKRVLFLRYALDPDADLSQALDAPVANVEWYLADSRDDVEQRLLELNELGPNGTYREYALVVDEPDDLERLKAAVALRETVKVNGSRRVLRLENFRVGRKLVVPQMQSARGKRMFLADRDVAEYFYKSDFYYSALQRTLERGYNRLQELTGGPDVEAHSSEGARR